MITPSGERIDNERRSCFKYFVTLLFLLFLILILRKQKEEEDELSNRSKMNLRQNENYRNFAFSYLREISYLKYDSAIYISPNRKIVPSITYINEYTIHVEGYDNILHNFENLSVGINEVNNHFYIYASEGNKIKNSVCRNEYYSDDSCATINTILVDKSLFKNMLIPSCNEKDSFFCFFVFVQLKKDKCYNFNNLSYSCHLNNIVKSPTVFQIKNYCYVVIASSKVHKIYEFVQVHLLNNEIPFNENTRTKEVEIVTHFCGHLLNQIAAIDAVNGRLLFIQQNIYTNDKNEKIENDQENENEHSSENRKNREIQENYKTKINKGKNEKEDYLKFMESYPINKFIKNENNGKRFKFQINYYLTIIKLKPENTGIIIYVEYMKNKPEFGLFPPIYIAFNEHSNLYYIVQHEKNGFLNFIFISPSTMSVYYTLKIREFYTGWLLNSAQAYDSKGLVLFGEYPPYEDELHVWDIRNLQHRKYFVNVIKAY
ncbi:hypothetical protein MKS88_004845 [Plasmodium brasilianum]|uniref:Uncharacterized protein n=2 Tax=Plasmodium (Plasmodium) TaxID=418103 RepID=A0A1A8X2F8_PLAMA|nr:conserved Plasmodium protein, unknown function [Plasmodium malariae]KAI4835633.1 hypothetical protein MKS88_004845 [Plasmodium brasilianum]SBS99426.1 hypothetical protein PMALA_069860 [Plasmodium malariae]SCP02561.1 conserved Plasmodium protein, unknown function [Plasmodium malariae]